MTEKSGTATNSQFVQVLYALSRAVATVIEGFAIGKLIRSLNVNGPKLKECLILVFTAITSGQKLVLRNLNPSDFPVWKTIQRGTIPRCSVRQSLRDAGCRVHPAARGIIRSRVFTVASSPVDVDLVLVTPAMIGFSGKTSYGSICARVLEIGLELCQGEDGVQLRLRHLDRSNSEEFLTVMMEGIVPVMSSKDFSPGSYVSGRKRDLEVFWLARQDGGELNLGTWGGDPNFEYPPSTVFVCVKPRAQ